MLATHAPKALNSRLNQPAFAAKLYAIPRHLICSGTVIMQQELFAAPKNAADIKKWRGADPALADYDQSLPDVVDPGCKQLLLPTQDWRSNEYIAVSPVPSMGVLAEMWRRMPEAKARSYVKMLQPTPAAMANHGEVVLMQSGQVRLFVRSVKSIRVPASDWTGDFVQITALCDGINLDNGMLSAGIPAVTAIGGAVHVIERETGLDIDFAIGIQHSNKHRGIQKIAGVRNGAGRTYANGRIPGKGFVSVPAYDSSEIVGVARIVLLLRTASVDALDSIAEAAKKLTRIAGGTLFDVEIKTVTNGHAPKATYLTEHHAPIIPFSDALYAAIGNYKQWRLGVVPVMTGYALLEDPQERRNARAKLHAWAEPVFSQVRFSVMSEDAFWTRHNELWGVRWCSVNLSSTEKRG